MALVNTGIVDFSSKVSLDPADLDASLAAVVGQLGGISWTTGTSATSAGNLDATNIASQAGFTNSQKAQPHSLTVLHSYENSYAPSGAAFVCPGSPISAPLICVGLTLSFSGVTASATGSADIYVNGAAAASIVLPGNGLEVGVPLTSVASFTMVPGDVWMTVLRLTAGGVITDVMVHLFCKALHVP